MKFMITFNHVEGVWANVSDDRRRQHAGELKAFSEALAAVGSHLVFFAPVEQAKTVRLYADGKMDVHDGPFRAGHEQPGGYFIVEVASVDEAVAWARRGRFLTGSNEVRQIVERGAP